MYSIINFWFLYICNAIPSIATKAVKINSERFLPIYPICEIYLGDSHRINTCLILTIQQFDKVNSSLALRGFETCFICRASSLCSIRLSIVSTLLLAIKGMLIIVMISIAIVIIFFLPLLFIFFSFIVWINYWPELFFKFPLINEPNC